MRSTANPINKFPGMYDAVGRALVRMGDPEKIYIDDIREAVAAEFEVEIKKGHYRNMDKSFNCSVSRAVREKGYRKVNASKTFQKLPMGNKAGVTA